MLGSIWPLGENLSEQGGEKKVQPVTRRVKLTRKRILITAALLGIAAYAVWLLLIPAGRCLGLDCVKHWGGYSESTVLSEFNDVWQQERNASVFMPWTAARTDGLQRVGGDWSRQCMRVRVYDLPQASDNEGVPYLWQEYSSCYHIDGAFPFPDEWRLIPATDEEQLAWTREIAAEDETWNRLVDKGIYFYDAPGTS